MKSLIHFHNENLVLAENLAAPISLLSWVRAVMLYGSVGKGYSDQSSDIDLLIICDGTLRSLHKKTEMIMRLFPEYELVFKQQELNVLQFDYYPVLYNRSVPYQSYRAQCNVVHEGRLIDVTIRLVSQDIVTLLTRDAVTNMYTYQTLVQYFVDTRTLYDRDATVTPWKKTIGAFKTFSPKLYQTFLDYCFNRINYYLAGEIPDGLARNDIVLLNHELGKCLVLILHVIYALNDRCLTYPKWEHEDIKKLPIKPNRAHQILERVIRTHNPKPLHGLLRELRSLSENV